MATLPHEYFQNKDVLALSQQLLGKQIYTYFDDCLTGGIIVETEAYKAPEDRASHAYNFRKTNRNEIMYEVGGHIYVYICYGIHALLNIVTNEKDVPHAILIRAIEPTTGIDMMLKRRNKVKLQRGLTAGPGALTTALGINKIHNGLKIPCPYLWIEDAPELSNDMIIASPRVGIDYAGEDAFLPWRFRIKNNLWTSPAK